MQPYRWKEFIDGGTIYELILQDKMKSVYVEQLHRMCALLFDGRDGDELEVTGIYTPVLENGERTAE